MTFLYQPVNENDAVEAFRRMGRLDTGNGSGNFTISAINALVEYYHELAIDLDEPIELDVIAWCCDWAQYDSIVEAAEEYDNDDTVADLLADYRMAQREVDSDLSDDLEDELLEWFRDQTTVIEFDGGVLIQNF